MTTDSKFWFLRIDFKKRLVRSEEGILSFKGLLTLHSWTFLSPTFHYPDHIPSFLLLLFFALK